MNSLKTTGSNVEFNFFFISVTLKYQYLFSTMTQQMQFVAYVKVRKWLKSWPTSRNPKSPWNQNVKSVLHMEFIERGQF
jgi:hypothetical protein